VGRSSGVLFSATQAVQSITGTASPTPSVTSLLLCASATSYTVTLPTAVGRTGVRLDLKNTGTKTLTVAASGGQTIDGAPTYTLNKMNAVSLVSDNANWWII
jgi:hypothetical protein